MAAAELRKLRDTDQTVAASDEDVRGRKMLDSTGEDIGTIDGLMVDDDQNKVRFLRVKSGGFLGLGAHHVMIPVELITGITADVVSIDRSREHLVNAPKYDPALVADRDEHYWGGIYDYYGFAPYWRTGYAYPPYPYYSAR